VLRALRLSVSILTRLPVRAPERPDRSMVGGAMAWAPIVGLAIGGVAAEVLVLARAAAGGAATLLPAALAVTAIVAMTGALHLDGLADTADALGVRGGPERAREVAKQSTTGAFGVSAIVVVLLVDVAAVATAAGQSRGVTALVVAAAGGRLAATWSCRDEAPATDVGLGAWVARSVRTRDALVATVVTFIVCAAVAAADHRHRVAAVVTAVAAVAVALVAGFVVRRVGCRAFGGLTGDVLGATISCGTTAAYVVIALTGSLVG
jgi:adenosylcobinamide-GDP ribazoletransferase